MQFCCLGLVLELSFPVLALVLLLILAMLNDVKLNNLAQPWSRRLMSWPWSWSWVCSPSAVTVVIFVLVFAWIFCTWLVVYYLRSCGLLLHVGCKVVNRLVPVVGLLTHLASHNDHAHSAAKPLIQILSLLSILRPMITRSRTASVQCASWSVVRCSKPSSRHMLTHTSMVNVVIRMLRACRWQ